jgi:hypothetical protein
MLLGRLQDATYIRRNQKICSSHLPRQVQPVVPLQRSRTNMREASFSCAFLNHAIRELLMDTFISEHSTVTRYCADGWSWGSSTRIEPRIHNVAASSCECE